MSKTLRIGTTADRFVETTLKLIAENGGSEHVNLRQISRRMGCAHTNAYNYFASYQDLLWTAFGRTLVIYGDWLTKELDDSLPPDAYLRRLLVNLATFPQAQPGLYRFIASDPMPISDIPADLLDTVSHMKRWLSKTLAAVSGAAMTPRDAGIIADIVLAYVDGETLNLINQRVVPGEDVHGRIVDNAMRVYGLLIADAASGGRSMGANAPRPPYPKLHAGRNGKGE
jgi:AcrR family transcriptional regulator